MPNNLYALLIGIDQYQYISGLGGCKEDIQKVDTYLQQAAEQNGFAYHPKILFDQDATRAGILDGFEQHLIAQSKQGDLALIYYAGHGAQEEAGPLFAQAEYDGKLEGWVCHDTGQDQSHTAPMVVDKELRYLIHRLSQREADILLISDSCHSNDNTRSAQLTGDEEPQKLVRRTGITLPARRYEQFVFANAIPEASFSTQSLSEVLPQGRAVSIAACESWEFAYETNGGGIFTHYLIETLKNSRGGLSYHDLQSRVRMRIRTQLEGVSQIPRVAATPDYPDDVFREFLSGAVRNRPLYGNLTNQRYSSREGDQVSLWDYDKGEIHGVKRVASSDDERRIAIPLPDGETAYGYIKEVGTNDSVVEVKPTERSFDLLQPDQTYEGYLPGLMSAPLVLHVRGEEEGVNKVKDYFQHKAALFEESKLSLTDRPAEAHYDVHAIHHGEHDRPYLIITSPRDTRPLAEQIQGWEETSLDTLFRQFNTVMPWHFLYHLRNDHHDALPDDAIGLSLEQEGQAVAVENGLGVLRYTGERDGVPRGKVRIKLSNQFSEKLFVACLFMDKDFSIAPQILQPTVVQLDPAGSIYAREGKEITIKYRPQLEWFNWPQDEFYLLVIASRENIEVDAFSQAGLKPPLFPWPERSLLRRGLSWAEEEEEEPAKTWQAIRFTLQVPNPRFRQEA